MNPLLRIRESMDSRKFLETLEFPMGGGGCQADAGKAFLQKGLPYRKNRQTKRLPSCIGRVDRRCLFPESMQEFLAARRAALKKGLIERGSAEESGGHYEKEKNLARK
ncbi:MAG: hypothetical protein KJ970_17535 [Candidatus Eisenbacteria bacterium]|uniref:Uncharacterized protein n=1 Tax=Eiseniibacteriota bacterium TaxID=2212470 RepID=A0A948W4Y0_UNCEI|nr:hypothetical protein [Candidatus Eisenbacteria bacterium]MBU1949819.1 hypothetical protein [Candidatus Eisenbacteria bacterium]MBU2692722.1 hypothetical protein [Candidatus Eisenbacteria bacterium]